MRTRRSLGALRRGTDQRIVNGQRSSVSSSAPSSCSLSCGACSGVSVAEQSAVVAVSPAATPAAHHRVEGGTRTTVTTNNLRLLHQRSNRTHNTNLMRRPCTRVVAATEVRRLRLSTRRIRVQHHTMKTPYQRCQAGAMPQAGMWRRKCPLRTSKWRNLTT